MNSKHRVAAAALIGALAVPGMAMAQNAYVTTDLNLRAGPGTDYPVVDAIPSDAGVTVHGCVEDLGWCDVSYNDLRGWASGSYIAYDVVGARIAVPQVTTQVEVPVVTYEAGTYFDTYYRERPFYAERDRFVTVDTGSTGAAAGIAGGAAAGAVLGGPIGAIIGGVAGAAMGAAVDPPAEVNTYVTTTAVDPVQLEGEIVVGAGLPDVVNLYDVPDYEYRYAIVNGQRVLVDPATRRVVYVYQ